jgi:hypothetical protein
VESILPITKKDNPGRKSSQEYGKMAAKQLVQPNARPRRQDYRPKNTGHLLPLEIACH